jgi:hypothetical protein
VNGEASQSLDARQALTAGEPAYGAWVLYLTVFALLEEIPVEAPL